MNIAVIIVLYNPNKDVINRRIRQIKSAKDINYIIVDNTPNQNLKLEFPNCHYIPLYTNTGIGNAQNIGIKKGVALNCNYIIFMDQDSNPCQDYFQQIVNEYDQIKKMYPNLFLLGPTIINGYELNKKTNTQSPNNANQNFIRKLDIISSGTCVDTLTISKVGYLESDLFIDSLDQEWCWRANDKNLINGITQNVILEHYVGNGTKHLGPFDIIISSPQRYYFQYRNWLWLMRRNYVPIKWKINTSIKRIIYPIFYPFLTKDWIKIYKNIGKGLVAGFKITHHDNK